jgi:hypothetical protein
VAAALRACATASLSTRATAAVADRLPERRTGRGLEPVAPSLARAAISPAALVVTLAGALIGLATHSWPLAVALAVLAWLGRMTAAVVVRRRHLAAARPRPAELDPWSVPAPWRGLVDQAARAQDRFDQALADWPEGPIRDRMTAVQPRLWEQMAAVADMARTGASIGSSPRSSEDVSGQLRAVQQERAGLGPAGGGRAAELGRREEALAAQLRSARKAEEASRDLFDRLETLVARLDGTVTDLLSLRADSQAAAGSEPLEAALDGLGDEITALRAGLAAVAAAEDAPALPSAPPPEPRHEPPTP